MPRERLSASAILGGQNVNSWVWPVLGLLVLQQLIVASSSVFLVEFLAALEKQGDWRLLLWLYLASVVAPYFPGFAANYFNQHWINSSCQRLWRWATESLSGKISLTFDVHKKSDFPTQVKEVGNLIEDSCRFIFTYFPSVLNFIFNGLVVAKLLGADFLAAFIVGFIISSIQIYLSSKIGSRWATDKQSATGHVDVHFAKGWQTLLIGNSPHEEEFRRSLANAQSDFFSKSLRLSRFENSTSLVFFFLGFLPTLMAIGHTAFARETSLPQLVALGALLPRIFQIYTVSSNVLIGAQQIFNLRGRWKSALLRLESTLLAPAIDSRIDPSKLALSGAQGPQNCEAFVRQTLTPGLWRLEGPNGAGKSSWMLKIKREFGARAYYLPTKSEEFVAGPSPSGLSTGQKKLSELKALQAQSALYDLLLLDEWDANLDARAKAEASEIIATMAKSLAIVECRH